MFWEVKNQKRKDSKDVFDKEGMLEAMQILNKHCGYMETMQLLSMLVLQNYVERLELETVASLFSKGLTATNTAGMLTERANLLGEDGEGKKKKKLTCLSRDE